VPATDRARLEELCRYLLRPPVAPEATTEWLELWEGADPRIFLRSVQGGGEFPQPNLIQYLLTIFYGGDPESVDYDQEVKASLFVLLKTLSDAVDVGESEQA